SHRPDQSGHARCRPYTLRRTHEQCVVEQNSKPAESVTHCRLPNADTTGGAGKVAFRCQSVKGHQQIQVETAEINVVDMQDDFYQLDWFRSGGYLRCIIHCSMKRDK